MSGPGEVTRVGVLGCGLMGPGIAEVSARAGVDVVVLEADEPAVGAGRRASRCRWAKSGRGLHQYG